MYLASCETEHFSFMALGESREQALEALSAAFEAHRKQYSHPGNPMRKGWWRDYDVTVFRMMPGQGYRDHEPVGEHVPDRL